MINVSDGTSHADEFEFLKSQYFDPKNAEPPAENLDSLWQNLSQEPPTDPNGNPLRGLRKPTGALESTQGTQVAGDVINFPSVMSDPNLGKPTPSSATINRILGRDNIVPIPIKK